MPNLQRTLILIKPDAIQRELVGEIYSKFERKGLKAIALKFTHLDDSTLTEHYGHLSAKPWFGELKKFMMQTPVVAMVLEGYDVIEVVRVIVGSTNPREADAGTIRSDYSMNVPSNIIHASDSIEAAASEIPRFFSPAEIFDYQKLTDRFHVGEGV